jgi:hypothetical protein
MSLEILATLISISTFAGGILAWYSANVQKRYAAQRDFEHLKRNYNQMAENLRGIQDDMDERFDTVDRSTADIKQKLNVIMIKILPETSTGWVKGPE